LVRERIVRPLPLYSSDYPLGGVSPPFFCAENTRRERKMKRPHRGCLGSARLSFGRGRHGAAAPSTV